MELLGIVTVLYNSDEVLDDFFKSISIQTFSRYKVYLVDNSVSERSDKLIASLSAKYSLTVVEHIRSSANLGIAEGNNVGMRKAMDDGCTHICLANNDISFLKANMLERLMMKTLEYPGAVLAPKIYATDGSTLWFAGGKYLDYKGSVWHDGYNQKDTGQFNKTREVDFAPACFVILPKAVVQEVGWMDEKYFVYVDDADYMMRLRQKGYKIIYLPEFDLVHKVSSSTGGVFSDFGIYYNTRNRIYWVRKLFKGASRYLSLLYIPFQMTYHLLRTGKRKKIKLLVSAIRDGFNMQF